MKHTKHRSGTRQVSYTYYVPTRDHFDDVDEPALERLFESALRRGHITAYDLGSGLMPWFVGYPGPELRAVKAEAEKIMGPTVKPYVFDGSNEPTPPCPRRVADEAITRMRAERAAMLKRIAKLEAGK